MSWMWWEIEWVSEWEREREREREKIIINRFISVELCSSSSIWNFGWIISRAFWNLWDEKSQLPKRLRVCACAFVDVFCVGVQRDTCVRKWHLCFMLDPMISKIIWNRERLFDIVEGYLKLGNGFSKKKIILNSCFPTSQNRSSSLAHSSKFVQEKRWYRKF